MNRAIRVRLRRIVGVVALALLAAPIAGRAHEASDAHLTLRAENGRLVGRWDLSLRDLELAIGLDGDADGRILWDELLARRDAIFDEAFANLEIASDGTGCAAIPRTLRVDHHGAETFAVLDFAVDCAADPDSLEIEYDFLFALDPNHRGLLRLEADGQTFSAVFAPSARRRSFVLDGSSSFGSGFFDYLSSGVHHLAIGFDHLLFLLSLLLPTVLRREAGRWRPVDRLGDAAMDAARLVTAFTCAHTLTLALAALEIVVLPSRWVESAIAASVVAAALHNLFPLAASARGRMAFGFGLVHGLGFASVLGDLGLPATGFATALIGFNLGVELGQLAGVVCLLPVLFAIRRSAAYRSIGLAFGSSAIALIGIGWLAERAFDLSF